MALNPAAYVETITCPLCKRPSNQPILTESIEINSIECTLGVNECESCRLCYTSPRLNETGLGSLYEGYMTQTVSGVYNVSEDVSALEYSQFAKYLNSVLPQGGNVLDVGCGVGNMLDAIVRSCPSIEGRGVEFSKFAGMEAQKKGHEVHFGDLTQLTDLPPGGFDAIVILYVLEHVPDPIAVLNKCRHLLKKGGKLLIAVPNYRYLKLTHTGLLGRILYGKSCNLFPAEHLFNYTPETIRKILNMAGFEVLRVGQAKPLKTGSIAHRALKVVFSGVFDLLFRLGYQLGGIHMIASPT